MANTADTSAPDETEPLCEPRTLFSLWLVVLGPPLLWLVQFQTMYTLVGWACRTGRYTVFPLVSAGSLLIAIGFGVFTLELWREVAQVPEGIPQRRSRFMLQLGFMLTALFALLIAAQGAAILFVDPCKR